MTRTLSRLVLTSSLAAALLGSVVLPSGNNAKADGETTSTPAPWTCNPGTAGTYTYTGGTESSWTYTPGYVTNHAVTCKVLGC